jgi:LPPG:FO 2-phospho-L-lactate transferase
LITVLAGGVGAARMLAGLLAVVDASEVTAIVNTGDDAVMHGLAISPDLDTITYTLAGAVNPVTGWGLAGETWSAMEALGRYSDETWFRLGDRDMATHLHRTGRLAEGATLSEVTAEITAAWGLGLRLVPMSDDPVRTRLRLADREVSFQEYFVKLRHSVPVVHVSFAGADVARPAPSVLEAIAAAETIVIAPSNPVVSIGPILAVAGIAEALRARRERVVAVSPIVGGAAIKGPADRLLAELGGESSAAGVARWHAAHAGTLVIDEVDRELAPAVQAAGMRCVVTDTVMRAPDVAAALARTVLAAPGAAQRAVAGDG